MKIYENIDQLVGNTPLFRANNIEKALGLNARLLFKLEYLNPAGSVKDRAALFMINQAEKEGKLKPGGTIIEPTSGNTGIGLSAIGVSRGYKVILTMPNSMSLERVKLLKAYGAEVILTDGKLGMQGAVDMASDINKKTPNSIVIGQFDNHSNPLAHYQTTAREIWQDTDGNVDIFVAGIGTGGTLCGTAKYLKEQKNDIFVVGVEPSSSPLLTKGFADRHKIQGIGANFIPKNFDKSLCNQVIPVTDEDAYSYTNLIAKKEGLLVGISSGAVVKAMVSLAKLKQYEGKTIVGILPDTGDRYLSVDNLF